MSFELRARHLFWGAQAYEIMTAATSREHITDVYYMMIVPWMHLHRRQVTGFERNGERVTIAFDGASRVEIDWEVKSYRVVLNGAEVANQDAIYCPLDEGRICMYSTQPQRLSAVLPTGWIAVEPGRITVQVNARQPVIVYRQKTM